MSDFAQHVKQHADIVRVIGGYIRLRKSGAQNYSGLCPFHQEKSPSFNVHAARQFFHCFGCGQSGDVFTFVAKIENLTFPEAVRSVAVKCGIPLPKREFNSPEEAAEAGLRRKLLDLHEVAALWFEEQLRSPEGALAREYLAGRGVTPEAIKTFRIGYAPESFNALRDRLSSMADEPTLRASGLVTSKDTEDREGNLVQGHIYDRFRKRVMFPIANESGRIIAFTARTLATGGEAEKAGPKYLNSPETPLYSKGQVLFNLDKAKTAIRQLEFALLVEGQMDCISVFMRGIQNVIATSGTAFTEQQVALLKRHLAQPPNKPQVVANFDPDLAGKNAAAKTIDLLAAEGFKIRIAVLEDGLDPDRFIRERGVEAYARAIRGARERRIFFIERARELFPGAGIDQKISQVEYLHPLIENSRDPLEKELFIEDAAQKLGIDPAVLRERFRRSMQGRRDRNEMRAEVRPSGITEVERVLLRALATQAECWGVAAEAVTEHPEWFEHLASFAALAALAAQPAPGQAGHLEPIAAVENPVQRALLAQVLLQEGDPPEESAVHGALHGLHLRRLENEQRTLRGEIGEAERRGDWAEVAVLSQRKLAVDREIRNLHQ